MDDNELIRDRVASVIAGANCYPFLFVGSGLSRRYMGTRSWEGLLEWLCKEVLGNGFAYTRVLNEAKNAVRNKRADSVMPYVATLLEDRIDEKLLTEDKFEWFRTRYKRELKAGISPMKQFIADDLSKAEVKECDEVKMLSGPCSKRLSGVITTNYDHLAEWLFPKSDVFVGGDDLLFREMSYADEIYKIHGSASDASSMILDQADYEDFRDRQDCLAAKILTLFIEYPIIFLGYSLQDPDMLSILESIAKCAGPHGAAILADRFIFVEYGDANGLPVQTMERAFGKKTIRMTHVTTKDFSPIYEAIASSEVRYDPRIVRMLKHSIYAIASHLDPVSTIVTSGFSKLDNLGENDRVIIGFNAIRESFGKMPTAEDLYYDVVFDEEDLNPALVVGDYLPKLLRSNPGGLPMFKYLRYADTSELDDRVLKQIEKNKSVSDFLNDQIRRSASGWRDHLAEYSIRGLVDAFGLENAHTRLAALYDSEIDAQQLGNHLERMISRGGGRELLKNNSELKRAIRIFDYLRYGTKT